MDRVPALSPVLFRDMNAQTFEIETRNRTQHSARRSICAALSSDRFFPEDVRVARGCCQNGFPGRTYEDNQLVFGVVIMAPVMTSLNNSGRLISISSLRRAATSRTHVFGFLASV
jgi:hypothetical protein